MAKKSAQKNAAKNSKEAKQPEVKYARFAVFSMKNGQVIKTPIEDENVGKLILVDVSQKLQAGQHYLNQDRGIFINHAEISHSYLTIERVQ